MSTRSSERAEMAAGPDTDRDCEKTWRRLYEETSPVLFNFLCYQTGDRDVAKDLLQETYVTAMRRMPSYRGDGPVIGWLRAIALRKCLDWRRRLKRRLGLMRSFAHESDPRTHHMPDDPTSDTLDPGFRAALMRLSAHQRAALLLRELEDLSFREIADTLGCAEATARVHHHRACHAMRTLLGTDCGLDVIEGGRS